MNTSSHIEDPSPAPINTTNTESKIAFLDVKAAQSAAISILSESFTEPLPNKRDLKPSRKITVTISAGEIRDNQFEIIILIGFTKFTVTCDRIKFAHTTGLINTLTLWKLSSVKEVPDHTRLASCIYVATNPSKQATPLETLSGQFFLHPSLAELRKNMEDAAVYREKMARKPIVTSSRLAMLVAVGISAAAAFTIYENKPTIIGQWSHTISSMVANSRAPQR